MPAVPPLLCRSRCIAVAAASECAAAEPHPKGLAPRIANLAEWRAHLADAAAPADRRYGGRELVKLLDELSGYPAPSGAEKRRALA